MSLYLQIRISLGLACGLAGAWAAAAEAPPAPANPDIASTELFRRADELLARGDLSAYRGWIKFLRFQAESALRSGAAGAPAGAAAQRLGEWLGRIAADPGLLSRLRGVQEWAYESPVDGSGQPFKVVIPSDYDPARPAPLSVYMHGSGGNHLEHSTTMAAHPGYFEMAVLGRAREGGFRALSEADVLQAIDYVEAHWSVDPARVALRGGSMGGGGTYRIGARYPQRWASGRPSCGFASTVPMGNLVTLPIYAVHSIDDPVVSILHERGPLAKLREQGGQVILDETNGYGHAVWNYQEGSRRGSAWAKDKVRPDSRSVLHIDYTALDGMAVRGWWGEVAEWGGAAGNARFVLTAGPANALFAQLTNVGRLRLRLDESPFDRAQPLQVSVNGAVPITLPAPLPAGAVLALGPGGWGFEAAPEKPPYRLHTPGGASLLYDGEPLLIVYGTRGTLAERTAMRSAAEAASRGPNPAWPDGSGERGDDGVPDLQNLYGQLNTKPDIEVTADDLARCHLVLIGTAEQNILVGRMADRLPARLGKAAVTCDDGIAFAGADLALGLVCYNPLAPGRLIFWVASDNLATYAAGSLIPLIMGGGGSIAGNGFGADLLVMAADRPSLVAARAFDSRWHWIPGREHSPLLGASYARTSGVSGGLASALRRATGADYAMVGVYGLPAVPPVEVGVTRVSDLAPAFSNIPVGVFWVQGSELLTMAREAAAGQPVILIPGLDPARIDPTATYGVALPVNLLWAFSALFKTAPASYRLTDLDTEAVVERFLPPD